jgi:uncharacterized protein involved in exopolysaccharide biosynthesis
MEEIQNKSVDPLKVVWSKKWQLLLFTMVVTIATYSFSSFLPESYQAKATVLSIPPSLDSAEKNSEALSMNSYKDLAMTAGFLQSVIDKYKSENPNSSIILYPEILEGMIEIVSATGISLKNQTPSALITFKIKGSDPKIITEIINILTDLLAEESRKLRANESAAISQFTQAQYISTKDALGKLEQTLQNVRMNNHLESGLANLLVKRVNLKHYEMELIKANVEFIEEESKLTFLTTQLAKHSDMVAENLLKTHTNHESLVAKQKFLTKSIAQLKKEIPQLEDKVLQMELQEEQLERQVTVLRSSFLVFTKRLAEAQISESKKTSDIRLISKAIEPHIPIGPNKLKFAFVAAALSFFLGLIVACSKEHLDNVS